MHTLLHRLRYAAVILSSICAAAAGIAFSDDERTYPYALAVVCIAGLAGSLFSSRAPSA